MKFSSQTCYSQMMPPCQLTRSNISLKKTNTMSQDTESLPAITMDNYQLDVVKEFTYFGSTMTDNLSMNSKISRRIGRDTSTLGSFSKIVWNNCVLSALLYDSESWTLYSLQERRLNTFHMRSLGQILGIKWSDRITNNEFLRRAATPSIYTLLRQRRVR